MPTTKIVSLKFYNGQVFANPVRATKKDIKKQFELNINPNIKEARDADQFYERSAATYTFKPIPFWARFSRTQKMELIFGLSICGTIKCTNNCLSCQRPESIAARNTVAELKDCAHR